MVKKETEDKLDEITSFIGVVNCPKCKEPIYVRTEVDDDWFREETK